MTAMDYGNVILFSLRCHRFLMRCLKRNHQPGKDMNMQIGSNRFISTSIVCLATGFLAGCASMREHDVTLAQVSEPARATINKETAGGHVDKISKEFERGKSVYDVEATVGGKHMEYLVADA